MEEKTIPLRFLSKGNENQPYRTIILVLASIILISSIATVALMSDCSDAAEDSQMEVDYEFSSDNLKYRITSVDPYEAQLIGYDSISKNLEVPESVICLGAEVEVTSIGKQAFMGCTAIVKADLGDVSEIGVKAFANCTGLKSVDVGDSLKTVSAYAFYRCTRLVDIDIEDSAKTMRDIGSYAFYKCSKLSSIAIPSYMNTMGGKAFSISFVDAEGNELDYSLDSLKGYLYENVDGKLVRQSGPELGKGYAYGKLTYKVIATLPAELEVSGYSDQFRNVTVPESLEFDGYEFDVTAIGDGAFKGYVKIRTVSMPYIEKIGKESFYGCTYIKPVDLDSIRSIGVKSFAKCTNMGAVEFGDSLKKIGNYAFYICKSLESVDIPESVTSIGSYAFYKCYNLSEVDLGDSLKKIGSRAFAKTAVQDIEIPSKVASIGSYAFYSCTKLKTIDMCGESVKIGSSAFANCDAIEHIEMPDTIARLGSKAFDGITFYSFDETELAHTAENLSAKVFDGSDSVLICADGEYQMVYPSVVSVEYDSSASTDMRITTDINFSERVCQYYIYDSNGVIQLHGPSTSPSSYFLLDTTIAAAGYLADDSFKLYFDNKTVPYEFDIFKLTFDGNGTSMKSMTVHLSTDSLASYSMPTGFVWNTKSDATGTWVSDLALVDFENNSATLYAFNIADEPTEREKEALEGANRYVKATAISKLGVVDMLVYDKFTQEEAEYGAAKCGADWKAEAVEDANRYLKISDMTRQDVLDMLVYDKFTQEEAEYGADNCAADWNA